MCYGNGMAAEIAETRKGLEKAHSGKARTPRVSKGRIRLPLVAIWLAVTRNAVSDDIMDTIWQ